MSCCVIACDLTVFTKEERAELRISGPPEAKEILRDALRLTRAAP